MTKRPSLLQAILIGFLSIVLTGLTNAAASAQAVSYETEIYIGPYTKIGNISMFILRKADTADLQFRRTDSINYNTLQKDERWKKIFRSNLTKEESQAVTDAVIQSTTYKIYTVELSDSEPFVAALDSFYTFDEEFLKRHAKNRIGLDGTTVSIVQKADGRLVKKLSFWQPRSSTYPEVARLISLAMQYYDKTKFL